MNFATFAGRLGRDADLRDANGQQVLNFSLAVDVGFGQNKDTLWVGCALWGDRGAKLAQYLTKGKSVTVAGDVGLRRFQKRDGSNDSEITLNVMRLTLQGGNDQGSGGSSAPAPRPTSAPRQQQLAPAAAAAVDFDDDIPF